MLTAALILEGNKYYIVKSASMVKTYQDYVIGVPETPQWVQIYKPFGYDLQPPNVDINECTIQFMRKYGIENVRGGKYSNLNLHPEQIDELELLISEKQKETLYTITVEDPHTCKKCGIIYPSYVDHIANCQKKSLSRCILL